MTDKLKKRGRPTGLTDSIRRALIAAYRGNCSIAAASGACSIPPTTLHRWLGQGRDGHPDYVELFVEFARLRAELIDHNSGLVQRIAESGDTPQALRAAIRTLERLDPEWAQNETTHHVVVTNTSESDATKRFASLTAEQLDVIELLNDEVLEGDEVEDD